MAKAHSSKYLNYCSCDCLDPIPPADGDIHVLQGMVTYKACSTIKQMPQGPVSVEIKVKNCTTYRVYFLKPAPLCNAAYCLGL